VSVAGGSGVDGVSSALREADGQGRQIPRPTRATVARSSQPPLHTLNRITSIALVILLALAPIPLGSNRPAFWTMWAFYLGAVALIYGLMLLWLKAEPRIGFRHLWPEAVIFGVLMLYTAAQLLPLQGLFGGAGGINGLPNAPAISFDPGSTRLVALQFASFAILYFLMVQVAANRRRARTLLLAMFFIIALFAAYGLISLTQLGDTLLGFQKTAYQGFATSTFINRNSFATFLAMGIAIGTALLLQLGVDWKTYPLPRAMMLGAAVIIGICFSAAALLATGSRMGIFVAIAGTLTVALVGLLANRADRRLTLLIVAGLIVVATVVLGIFGEEAVERLVFTPTVDESRVEIHRQLWAAILQRPFTGYGAGSFATVFQTLQAAPLAPSLYFENAHSTYLALWFEYGLVAGSLPLLIVGIAVVRAVMSLGNRSNTVIALASIGAVTVMGLHSTLDFSAEIEANAFIFTAILALGAAGAVQSSTRAAA